MTNEKTAVGGMTLDQFSQSIEDSKPCVCGCRLVEITEDSVVCARCRKQINAGDAR
jgi:hypothetical protein